MLKIYTIFIVVLLIVGFIPTKEHYLLAEPLVEAQKPTINTLIDQYATLYDVSAITMHKVIKCESGYNPKAIGDGGKSYGLVQIHLPSHPTITKEQAFDSEYAINFLAKNLDAGKGKLWTCYRLIKGV